MDGIEQPHAKHVPALAYIPLLWIVNAKRLAVHAVLDETSFPSARFQFPGVCFHVYKRFGADGPQVVKGRLLAVEGLVRRPVAQGGVRNPVPQVKCCLHQFPPKKVRQTGVCQQAPNNAGQRPTDPLVGADLLGNTGGSKLYFHADFRTIFAER